MNAFDTDGYNCLHRATSFGHANILDMLASQKYGRTKNLYWDEDYLDRLTNTSPQLSALQIACQRKDMKCVNILLKYGAKPRKRTEDERQCIDILQKYGVVKAPQKDKFSISSEFDVISWNQFIKTRNLLSNVKHEEIIFNCLIKYSNMKCCKIKKNKENNMRGIFNFCIAKKCLKCLRHVSTIKTLLTIANSPPISKLVEGSVTRTDSKVFNVICYLCKNNVDISDYLLNQDLHACILGNLPRESVSLLIRAYGMNVFSLWWHAIGNLETMKLLGYYIWQYKNLHCVIIYVLNRKIV